MHLDECRLAAAAIGSTAQHRRRPALGDRQHAASRPCKHHIPIGAGDHQPIRRSSTRGPRHRHVRHDQRRFHRTLHRVRHRLREVACRVVREEVVGRLAGARPLHHDERADPVADAECEHAVVRLVAPDDVDDRHLVRHLPIRDQEDVPEPLTGLREDVTQRGLDLRPTHVGLETVHRRHRRRHVPLRRLLCSREEPLEGRAEGDDVEQRVTWQQPQCPRQSIPRHCNRRAIHRPAAIDDEDVLQLAPCHVPRHLLHQLLRHKRQVHAASPALQLCHLRHRRRMILDRAEAQHDHPVRLRRCQRRPHVRPQIIDAGLRVRHW
jgi:hypothetical protein